MTGAHKSKPVLAALVVGLAMLSIAPPAVAKPPNAATVRFEGNQLWMAKWVGSDELTEFQFAAYNGEFASKGTSESDTLAKVSGRTDTCIENAVSGFWVKVYRDWVGYSFGDIVTFIDPYAGSLDVVLPLAGYEAVFAATPIIDPETGRVYCEDGSLLSSSDLTGELAVTVSWQSEFGEEAQGKSGKVKTEYLWTDIMTGAAAISVDGGPPVDLALDVGYQTFDARSGPMSGFVSWNETPNPWWR